MDIQLEVGDRVTYYFLGNERIYIEIVNDESKKVSLKQANVVILKIERPKWEVVEENKEWLTDEEREFLQLVLKFMKTEIKCITKRINWNGELEMIFSKNEDGSGAGYWYYIKNSYFKNLEEREYTLKELRIGGINGRN